MNVTILLVIAVAGIAIAIGKIVSRTIDEEDDDE